jgi:glycosyltransferase involved in cell wall biosynthesis
MQALPGRKNVLMVDLGAVFGGVEIYLENLLQALNPHADCLVLCSNEELKRRLRDSGVKYLSLPSCTGIAKSLQLLAAFVMLPYLLVRHDIEIVQINGYGEIILLPLARLMGRTAVATRHLSFDIEVDHWHQAPGRFLARFLYRHLARFASRIVCVSQEVGQEVGELVPSERVAIIPNWVEAIPPFAVKRLVRNAPVNILFVARMVEHKGLQVLLGAIRHLKNNNRDLDLKVTAVGDGPFRPQLEQLAEGLDVHFAGFQSGVDSFYEEADIFVSTSLGPEGSSLVAMEAMARCVPCILSNLPVHREIALQGEAAVLFELGDSIDLANKLVAMVENDSLRRHYAEAGYRTVKLNHNPEFAADAYSKAFGIMEREGELATADV